MRLHCIVFTRPDKQSILVTAVEDRYAVCDIDIPAKDPPLLTYHAYNASIDEAAEALADLHIEDDPDAEPVRHHLHRSYRSLLGHLGD